MRAEPFRESPTAVVGVALASALSLAPSTPLRGRVDSTAVMAVSPCSLKGLGTVLKESFAARSKWYYIGLELGVEASELDAIKKDNPEVKDCYLEALKCWLKSVAPKPTWAALAEALASDMVDEGGLAEKLREKYCPASHKSSVGRGELCMEAAISK